LEKEVHVLEKQNGLPNDKVKKLESEKSAKRTDLLKKRIKDLERKNHVLTEQHEKTKEIQKGIAQLKHDASTDELKGEHSRGFKMVYRLLMNECGRTQETAQEDRKRMRVTVVLALNGCLKELLEN
jgi:hypothetical protein